MEIPSEFESILSPPKSVYKMTSWDPELFKKTVIVSYLSLPQEKLSRIPKKFKDNFLKIPNLAPIQEESETSTRKRVLLNPAKIRTFEDIQESDRQFLETTFCVGQSEFGQMEVELSADNYRPNIMLKAVLPIGEVEGLSSYSNIGHIIHVNLKDELEPYKSVIGQILLRLPNVRIVVNKTSMIDNTYRNFEMEVIAKKVENSNNHSNGSEENDFIVSVRENGSKFSFDFSKVYWNPRLSNEHQSIVDLLKDGDVLFDVFAGVGPFSVPAAVKSKITNKNPTGIRIHSNDLNPESFRWLQHNFLLNKIPSSQYSCHNKDGKDFIEKEVKQGLLAYFKAADMSGSCHIVMNLPAMAIEFLKHFHGLLDQEIDQIESKRDPLVHVYCFSKEDDKESDVRKRCCEEFGGKELEDLKVSFVRNVAPNKDMMRATFPLKRNLLIKCDEPESKKVKLG